MELSLQVLVLIFGKSTNILSHLWAANLTNKQAMRHKTPPKYITHPCQTFKRCLPTFICNGCAYGAIIIALSLQVQALIWEMSTYIEILLGYKPYPLRKRWGLRPTHWGSHILGRHMLGGFLTFICNSWKYGAIIIALWLQVLVQTWENREQTLSHCWTINLTKKQAMRHETHPKWITHAFKIYSSCKLTFHMKKMGIWCHHHCISTAGASPYLGKWAVILSHCWTINLTNKQAMRHKTHPKYISRCF